MTRIEMLCTGEEVLHGQILDSNGAWLATLLFQTGIPMTSRMTVGDSLVELISAMKDRSAVADVIIVNGGLGPTSDDLSSQAAAEVSEDKLELRDEWVVKMKQFFEKRNRKMADSNLKQAYLPSKAILIDNPVGTACGFSIKVKNCVLYFTPGVPSEFKQMIKDKIIPDILKLCPVSDPPLCLRLTTFGQAESDLAQKLDMLKMPSEKVQLGYRASLPIIEIKLTGPESLRSEIEDLWINEIKPKVSEDMIFEGTESFGVQLAKNLNEKNYSVCCQEGFTAGLLSLTLTNSGVSLKGSEIESRHKSSLDDFSINLLNFSDNKSADIGLSISDIFMTDKGSEIVFGMKTPDRIVYAQRFCFRILNSFNLEDRQKIICTCIMNMMRRWLIGKSPTECRGWIQPVETSSLQY